MRKYDASDSTSTSTSPSLDACLTPAQRRVADYVHDGLNNREIAQLLGLSRYTVESHLAAAFKRLGITSRVDLAVLVTESQDHRRHTPPPRP